MIGPAVLLFTYKIVWGSTDDVVGLNMLTLTIALYTLLTRVRGHACTFYPHNSRRYTKVFLF